MNDDTLGDADAIDVVAEVDIVEARRRGKDLAIKAGIRGTDLTLLATAISEITRNILKYAGRGVVELHVVRRGGVGGLRVIARDNGPGIGDVARAMEDGFSTGDGLGLGLPGTRRLMDEFDVQSTMGVGTTVIMIKWARDD